MDVRLDHDAGGPVWIGEERTDAFEVVVVQLVFDLLRVFIDLQFQAPAADSRDRAGNFVDAAQRGLESILVPVVVRARDIRHGSGGEEESGDHDQESLVHMSLPFDLGQA